MALRAEHSRLILAGFTFFGFAYLVIPAHVRAASSPVSLNETIGSDIDVRERDAYHLFPGVPGFVHARLVQSGKNGIRLEYIYQKGSVTHTRSHKLPPEALEEIRLHVALVDAYNASEGLSLDSLGPAAALKVMVLRFASETRYDLATGVVNYLGAGYPQTYEGQWAQEYGPQISALAHHPQALFANQSFVDQRGRGDLIVFSGLYGIWLGLAIPVTIEAEDAKSYAAGLLIAPPMAVLIASSATRNADITEGQATMISLGGKLGTWQGLGWSSMSDASGNRVVGTGVATGLAGIVSAVILTHATQFSEGHAAITSSSMYWGGWFGLVVAELADHDQVDHGVLRDMLLGSDALVLTSAIAARGADLSEGRMRLINLSGVLGTVAGFGFDLLTEVQSGKVAISVAALGTVAGLSAGAAATRNYDHDRDARSASDGLSVEFPRLSMRGDGKGRVPTVGVTARF